MNHKRLLTVLLALVLGMALFAVGTLAAEIPEAPELEGWYNSAEDYITLSWDAVDSAENYEILINDEFFAYSFPGATYANIGGLDPLKDYKFSVCAIDADGNKSPYSDITVSYGLKTPKVKGSNVASSGKVKLTWDPVEGAEKYEVYRATSKSGPYKLLKTVSSTSFTNTSTTAGTTYYYIVMAIADDSKYNSVFSSIVTRTCDLPRPVVTAGNVASSGKVKLTWEAIDGAKEYKVYRATSKDGEYKLMKTTSGTSYTNTAAEACKSYYYKVKAIHSKSAANSAYSSAKLRTCDLPRPVVTAGNVASSGKVKLTWDAIDGAEEYKVYRATSKDGEYKLMKTTTGTSYTNTSGTTGTTYYYKVKAYAEKSAANSAYSLIKSRAVDCPQPKVKVTEHSASYIRVSWDKVTGASKYSVYRSTSEDGEYSFIKTVTGTSLKNTSVEPGMTYYYKVKAIHSKSSANSAYSEIASGMTVPMQAEMKSSASVTSSSITVKWNEVDDASGYYVYRRTSESDSWKRIKTITYGSTTSYKNTDLNSGKYFYCVAAYQTVDGTKYVGDKSEAFCGRTLAKPAATAAYGDSDMHNVITWDACSQATGYQVWARIGTDGSWKRITTTDSDVLSYEHEVEAGKCYYYRVRAIFDYNGDMSYGSYSSVTSKLLWYYEPSISYVMDGDSEDGQALALILIQNNGSDTLRFYSEDGSWLDPEFYSYDCGLTLIDFDDANDYGIITPVSYVDIAPGEQGYIAIAADDYTRYVDGTTVCLTMRYQGVYFDITVNCDEFSIALSDLN